MAALLATCAIVGLSASACSSDRDTTSLGPTTVVTSTTAATSTAPSTTEAPTTTVAPTITTAAPTTTAVPTSTTEAPTTTTEPLGASVPLRFDGVGDARFGSDPEDVIAYLTSQLGPPNADSTWVPADQIGCKGDEARVVFFSDLRLSFGDESNVSSGRRHFFAWRFGPPAETSPIPAGLKTMLGLTVGSTVEQVRALYPAAQFVPGDDTTTPSVQLGDGLFAYLTDVNPGGVVTQVLGGEQCSQ
jgi:hypothetical protein